MKVSRIILLTFCSICMILFSACPKEKISVLAVTLNKKELALVPGDTITLIATIDPVNADNKELFWESSNPAVATVDGKGLVSAINDGKATITVTSINENKTANCIVVVDYRSHWLGSYSCDEAHHFEFYNYPQIIDTIYFYQVMIDVTAKEDSMLLFKENRNNKSYKIKTDAFGNFREDNSMDFHRFEGNFSGDSLFLFIEFPHGIAVQDLSSTYKGSKISTIPL